MHTTEGEENEFVNELNNSLGINIFPMNSPIIENPKEFGDLDPIQVLNKLNQKAMEMFYLAQYISKQNQAIASFSESAELLVAENLLTQKIIKDSNKFHIKSLQNSTIDFFNNLKKEKIQLSDYSIKSLDQIGDFTKSIVDTHEIKIPKIMRFLEKIQYWILGFSLFLILLIVFTTYMSTNWYKTAVRTKEEIREEVLAEIVNSKQKIYSIDYVSKLQENTIIIQTWMEKNEKSAEVDKFIQFKQGYKANK